MTVIIEKHPNCRDVYVKYYTLSQNIHLSINDEKYEIFNYSSVIKKDDFITFMYQQYKCELSFNGNDYFLYIKKLN